MDYLLNIVSAHLSSAETTPEKLVKFSAKVPIWEYAKNYKIRIWNFQKRGHKQLVC